MAGRPAGRSVEESREMNENSLYHIKLIMEQLEGFKSLTVLRAVRKENEQTALTSFEYYNKSRSLERKVPTATIKCCSLQIREMKNKMQS